MKNAAVGSPAGTPSRACGGDAGFREFCGEGLQIARMSGPADEARLGQLGNCRVLLRAGLLGVGGDDFKIPPCAEREERVLRATSWMDAAKRSANARMLFDKGDAAVEIAAAQKNVIEQRGHVIRRPRECWRGKSAPSEAEKDSARNESRH